MIDGEKLKISATIPLPNKVHEREIVKVDTPDTFDSGATLGPINPVRNRTQTHASSKTLRSYKVEHVKGLSLSGQASAISNGVNQTKMERIWNKHKQLNPVRSKTPLASADARAHRTSNGVNTTLKPKVFVGL